MKARITQFYQDKLQPRIEALNARAAHLKQRIAGWATRHKRCLQAAAVMIVWVVASLALALLWRRSPAFRVVVKRLAAAVGLLPNGQPDEVPVPVAVTEAPYPAEEIAPVAAGDQAGW
jgi:hypothetical protein